MARARLSMTVSITWRAWKREAGLAGVVDLLRANDDDLRALELLRELRRLQARAARRASMSTSFGTRAAANFFRAAEVGQERVVDARAELAVLLDDAEARRRARHERRHADRRDARQRADGVAHARPRTLFGSRSASSTPISKRIASTRK